MSYYQPYRQNPYYGATGPMQQAVYPQYQQSTTNSFHKCQL